MSDENPTEEQTEPAAPVKPTQGEMMEHLGTFASNEGSALARQALVLLLQKIVLSL